MSFFGGSFQSLGDLLHSDCCCCCCRCWFYNSPNTDLIKLYNVQQVPPPLPCQEYRPKAKRRCPRSSPMWTSLFPSLAPCNTLATRYGFRGDSFSMFTVAVSSSGANLFGNLNNTTNPAVYRSGRRRTHEWDNWFSFDIQTGHRPTAIGRHCHRGIADLSIRGPQCAAVRVRIFCDFYMTSPRHTVTKAQSYKAVQSVQWMASEVPTRQAARSISVCADKISSFMRFLMNLWTGVLCGSRCLLCRGESPNRAE